MENFIVQRITCRPWFAHPARRKKEFFYRRFDELPVSLRTGAVDLTVPKKNKTLMSVVAHFHVNGLLLAGRETFPQNFVECFRRKTVESFVFAEVWKCDFHRVFILVKESVRA